MKNKQYLLISGYSECIETGTITEKELNTHAKENGLTEDEDILGDYLETISHNSEHYTIIEANKNNITEIEKLLKELKKEDEGK